MGFFDESTTKTKITYNIPPFSILDCKTKFWVRRKLFWRKLGIQSELGRDAPVYVNFKPHIGNPERFTNKTTSIFDPVLCEFVYEWFVPKNGKLLDPFAGGSVRGIVAQYLGYDYTGIDLSEKQIKSNIKQAKKILDKTNQPIWHTGNSINVLDTLKYSYDAIFTCPPYGSLEKYSDLEEDLSNMPYCDFIKAYKTILQKSIDLLKQSAYLCIVVGEFRDKNGGCVGFVPDTIKLIQSMGMVYYNEIILLTQLGNAGMRIKTCIKNQKMVKVHQNVLVFKKE